MGYTYEQRKRPQVPQKTVPERTNASEPVSIAHRFGTSASQNGPSFDLDAVMQARMTTTFGDLSAMRDYTPPGRDPCPPSDRAIHRSRYPRRLRCLPLPFRGRTYAPRGSRTAQTGSIWRI